MERRVQAGFTLLELMAAVAVLGILLAVGIPSLAETIRANRLSATTNDLVTALNIARSEATKRGIGVTVCAANSAQTGCAGSASWGNGWIVITDDSDTAGNTAGQLDGNDQLLQTFPAPMSGYSVTPTSPASLAYLRFRRDGRLDSAATDTMKLSRPDCTGSKARQVAVGTTGRISSGAVTC